MPVPKLQTIVSIEMFSDSLVANKRQRVRNVILETILKLKAKTGSKHTLSETIKQKLVREEFLSLHIHQPRKKEKKTNLN